MFELSGFLPMNRFKNNTVVFSPNPPPKKNNQKRVYRSEVVAAPEIPTRRIIPPPLPEVPLISDATCLCRFNKDQSAQGSSTNLPNVTHCGIITHSKWASLPSVSLLECVFFFCRPSSWDPPLAADAARLISNYLKRLNRKVET